jgi:hypothetical protein
VFARLIRSPWRSRGRLLKRPGAEEIREQNEQERNGNEYEDSYFEYPI